MRHHKEGRSPPARRNWTTAFLLATAASVSAARGQATSPGGTMSDGGNPGAAPTTAPAASQPTTSPVLSQPPVAPAVPASDFSNMSIEDLMNIEVISFSKQKQHISEAPAAMSVITQDDIQHTHYQSIAEILRIAPGLNVEQVSPSVWNVGTRGFTSIFTDNLLVMMDGRSVYSPMFGGVYWNSVDYILPDIDRIEVVRGPGATLWGANAMNGVINIISKDAKDTQGLLLDSFVSTDGYIDSVRYGGKIGDLGYFRVYVKERSMDDHLLANVTPSTPIGDAQDNWDQQRTGFRADLNLSPADTLTIQGDYFNERAGSQVALQTFTPPFHGTNTGPFNADGGNLLARWTHTYSPTSDLSVQFYYDRLANLSRNLFADNQETDTLDLDMHHRFALGDRQEIIWGGDYRFTSAHMSNSPDVGSWSHPHSDLQTASVFIQDDFTIVPERLHIIAGTKLEYDSIAAGIVEPQPSIRAIWTPDGKNSLWAAVSRASRTPSVFEENLQPIFARFPGTEVHGVANPDIKPLGMIAYEAGYRVKPTPKLSLDFSAFYDTYDHSRTFNPVPGAPPVVNGITEIGMKWDDIQKAQTWGGEVSAVWNATDQLTLTGSYNFVSMVQFGPPAGIQSAPHADPSNQVKLQAHYAITHDLSADSQFYWVDRQKSINIPAYFRWDAGMSWNVNKNFSVSAGVWNILDNQHPEALDGFSSPHSSEIPRTFFLELQGRF